MDRKLSASDYNTLDQFVRTVLDRVQNGSFSALEGQGKIMHPLTAYIDGKNDSEFIPWMKMHLEAWKAGQDV